MFSKISSLIVSVTNNYDTVIIVIFSLIVYLTFSRILYPAYFGPLSKLPRDNNPFWHYFSYVYDSFKGDPAKHLKLSQKYGPVVFLTGNKVLINDPEARKQLMSYNFPKTKLYSVYNINGPNLLSTMDKDFHIRRKRLISPAFSSKTLAAMEPALYKTGSESLVRYLDSHLDNNPNRVFDLYHLFNCNTLDVISELVLGTKLNATWDEKKGLYYIKELAKTQFTLFKRVVIPFCGNIKLPMETLFKPVILDNINKRKLSNEVHNDILQSLMDIEDPETGARLSQSEIIDECLVLLLGGMGNTAITLTWTLYEIIKHPEILELITTEITNSFPNLNEPITYEAAKRDLKHLEAAILESMRMHPAVAGSLPRQVPKGGLTVNGHYIPSKTSITIDIYTEHNDPSFWENPREFNLNRWLGDHRETNKAKLAGFGLGTRACVGRDLAWSELFLVTANLIRHFNFELVDETLTPIYKFLYRPKEKRFKVRLSKKSKTNLLLSS